MAINVDILVTTLLGRVVAPDGVFWSARRLLNSKRSASIARKGKQKKKKKIGPVDADPRTENAWKNSMRPCPKAKQPAHKPRIEGLAPPQLIYNLLQIDQSDNNTMPVGWALKHSGIC